MNAKIMLLPADAMGEKLCSYAEECLTGISGAFGHSISLIREKIGERSVQAYGTPLTQETVDACRKCSGILLGDASAEGMDALAAALGLPAQIRREPGFSGSLQRGPLIVRAVSLEPDMLRAAAKKAFDTALREGKGLVHAAPSGKNTGAWRKQIDEMKAKYPGVRCTELPADRALSFMLEAPEEVGVLFCPPYVGKMFLAAFASLNDQPTLLYDCLEGGKNGLYAAVQKNRVDGPEQLSPLGILLAAAAMMRDTLHLEREAECLFSAVRNVYESGWRTGDMSGIRETVNGEKMVELILNQIELASRFV